MSDKIARRRRLIAVFSVTLVATGIATYHHLNQAQAPANNNSTISVYKVKKTPRSASRALEKLAIKNWDSMAGYNRQLFGGEWVNEGTCSNRDKILARDMEQETFKPNTCEVISGVLHDPYTGKTIHFKRGIGTSNKIQIDHVVAIGDAWRTGAQELPKQRREQLYNDPLELVASDGKANMEKGDSDAASWLPPSKSYHCRYVARQIAVKLKYSLWITKSEHSAMSRIISSCPKQLLPVRR